MSVCSFIASDFPLSEFAPSQNYPLEINIDTGTVYDGGADDNYFLLPFSDVGSYTDKSYGVSLEWHYTEGRAKQIIEYIKKTITDNLLDISAVHYNVLNNEYVIERCGFAVSFALFRNLLIQYHALLERSGNLVISSPLYVAV